MVMWFQWQNLYQNFWPKKKTSVNFRHFIPNP